METLTTCPRCGKALTAGFLRGPRGMLWTLQGGKRIFNIPAGEGEFELGNGLWGACCPGLYCEGCGLILIETEETS